MTAINQRLLLWVMGAVSLVFLNSCLKDHCSRTYTLYIPVYKTLAQVRADMKSGASRSVQSPGKLYVYGNYIFLNEQEKGIHVIDNSNPAAPRNISFIKIAGNVDLAVKGNTLYADSYSDLVTFDISDPKDVKAKHFVDNVFPHRNRYYNYNYPYNPVARNPDSVKVIVDWVTRDTTVDCGTYQVLYESFYALASSDRSGNYASPNIGGAGGSMARFTLMNNYLYTVTNSTLNAFDVSVAQQPSLINKKDLNNWTIETIYPFKDKLFIGSSSGMYIFTVNTPSSPEQLGTFSHVRSCDPVVADDKYAYVTLRSGTACQGFTNQLEVLNITQPTSPSLVKVYPMTNPHGLSKDNNLLFLCDGKDGLKVYDATNVDDLKLLKQIGGFETYDVIAWNNRAIVVAKDGLYQYSYADAKNIRLLSKIKIGKD